MAAASVSAMLDDAAALINFNREAGGIQLDLVAIKKELYQKSSECHQRGLSQTYKWQTEILHALRYVNAYDGSPQQLFVLLIKRRRKNVNMNLFQEEKALAN